MIEGVGMYVVQDQGYIGNGIDIFMGSRAEALNFGRQMHNVYVLRYGY